jgi:fumarate hydratase class II
LKCPRTSCGALKPSARSNISVSGRISFPAITAYATSKKAAAAANHADKRLDDQRYKLIVRTCDEILAGQHHDMFPLQVWMTDTSSARSCW